MAHSYSVVVPPPTPTAPLRLTPKTPRSDNTSFSRCFLPSIIYSPSSPSFLPGSGNGYESYSSVIMGGHGIPIPPIPPIIPTVPPRGPTPPLSKRPYNKHLRSHSSQSVTGARNRLFSPSQYAFQQPAPKGIGYAAPSTSYDTRGTPHFFTNNISGSRNRMSEGPIITPVPPTIRHKRSFKSNGHARSATIPVTLGAPGSLDVQTAILMAQKGREALPAEGRNRGSAKTSSYYPPMHPERREEHRTSGLVGRTDDQVPTIRVHSPNAFDPSLPTWASPLPRTLASPVPSIKVDLPSRRQNSIYSHQRASVFSRGQGSIDVATMNGSPGRCERSLSELFEGVEKLNAEMGGPDNKSLSTDSGENGVRIHVELYTAAEEDDDDESIITDPEEHMRSIGDTASIITNPEEEGLYRTSMCAPSFLRPEPTEKRGLLETKRSSSALPQAQLSSLISQSSQNRSHSVSSDNSESLSSDEVHSTPPTAIESHSDLLGALDELALAIQTFLPPSPPFRILEDEASDSRVESEPSTPQREALILKSPEPLIGVRSILPSIRNDSVISSSIGSPYVGNVELPAPNTPHLKPVNTTVRPPPRVASIPLPPARSLRSLRRSDLPMEETGSQQWDREKVATDVLQVVQKLRWDKAQRAWQLVKQAEVVPITMKQDISTSLPSGIQSMRFASTSIHDNASSNVTPILPPGRLEWAFLDPGMPSTTTDLKFIFRLCVAWRVHASQNALRHPFGAQEEVKVFVLGRTTDEFFELHEGLLEQYDLEPRRHQWTQPHEMGPRAKGCLERLDRPDNDENSSDLGWGAYKEQMTKKREMLESWVVSLMRLKGTSMQEVLEGQFIRTWMTPRRDGDCERVAGDWRRDGHGEVAFEERIARALEGSW